MNLENCQKENVRALGQGRLQNASHCLHLRASFRNAQQSFSQIETTP